MFGPNGRSTFGNREETFHHRGARYSRLLAEAEALFRAKFDISADWDVLFLTGSGTLANEAVAASLRWRAGVLDEDREFASRFAKLLSSHRKYAFALERPHLKVRVAYETADAKFMGGEAEKGQIWDMVSAFPYYRPAPEVQVWTTVSSKQLGALPVCSFVVVRRDAYEWLAGADERYSYLNLARYRDALRKGQSPHTPTIALLEDTVATLRTFDPALECQRINTRRASLMSALPDGIGYGEGPVVCVRPRALPDELVGAWDLYPGKNGPQVFLYAGTDDEFGRFVDDIKRGW
jgi:aspartate aminotransferase-like enzyme